MRDSYLVRRVSPPATGAIELTHPLWSGAHELEIIHFHPRSSDHRPRTRVRMLHDDANLYIRFEVEDRYVICTHTSFQDPVYRDSCVEFFFQPIKGPAYFNLEINCSGTFLFYYVQDATRTPTGLAKFTPIALDHAKLLTVAHSMPSSVATERTEPTPWSIACAIPLDVLEHYTGPLPALSKSIWRCNFYKCADQSSHPHWASWAPIGEELNFHSPDRFGTVQFE